MAPWRLRHKLGLGMLLVVATFALVLFVTLKALSFYNATMNTALVTPMLTARAPAQ